MSTAYNPTASTSELTDTPDPRRWAALVVLLAGSFLPPLDFFIVNTALPSIRAGLHASSATVQLVVSGYAASYAVFLITGGRLGDLYGRRRVFAAGLLGFAGASAICGVAWSPAVLIVGRVLQGVTAAVMAPQSLASIHALFPTNEKARALGYYGTTFGLAAVIGQMLGGALIAANPFGFGWRSIFLVNLPVAAFAIPAALLLIRESRAGRPPRLDARGVVLLAATLSALVVPLIAGREQGWPVWSIALLLGFLPLLALFWCHEHRVVRDGGDPLVIPAMLRAPGLLRGLAATLCFYAIAAFFLTFSIYEQSGLGRNSLYAGLALLPFAIGFMLGPLTSPRLHRHLGARTPVVGMVLEVIGLVGVALSVYTDTSYLLSSALFVLGFGQGIALPTLVRALIDRVEGKIAGLVSGLVSSTLQISAALSVAVIGGLFYMVQGIHPDPTATTYAFTISTVIIGVSLLMAALLVNGLEPARK